MYTNRSTAAMNRTTAENDPATRGQSTLKTPRHMQDHDIHSVLYPPTGTVYYHSDSRNKKITISFIF